MKRAVLVLLLALAGCSQHSDRKIIADCNPSSWLWKDNDGALSIGVVAEYAEPIAPGADVKQICPRLKEGAR